MTIVLIASGLALTVALVVARGGRRRREAAHYRHESAEVGAWLAEVMDSGPAAEPAGFAQLPGRPPDVARDGALSPD